MPTINMFSSAQKIKGQGVASAYLEQVRLVQEGLQDYTIKINKLGFGDINHYHTVDLKHYLSIPIAKKKGVTIGYVHFLPETIDNSLQLPRILKKIFYKYIIDFYDKMDFLVTVNPYFINKLEEYGINKEKIIYIPNFVSNKKFFPYDKEKKIEIRKKNNVKESDFIVLGVGQIQTRKGVKDFVEVAESIPEIQFFWAGGFSFGRITDGYKYLKEIVKNPPPNVKFLGIVDRNKMNNIYNMADILFLPSYNELFPMTILEAMNCNLPILLRNLPIYDQILFDFYLKGQNNDDFIKIIKRLKNDEKFYDKYRKKSVEGSKFYSEEGILKMWRECYKKALSVKREKI
ncbi:glycosyltransferase family 4 protein [Defluviitalea phaphyphila]|uniref:glycosyltransferase family 4 protein n=1 Tax=Defluviitalea phaphyphila TaxID=1473580 RepID=UPI00072FBB2A|nr:glycosyltransferase [Defluviitalea phaphyphila]